MKSNQENKLSMYYTVQKVCSANNGVWNTLPAFVTAFNEFEKNLRRIRAVLGVQETNIQGVALKKESVKDSMIDKGLEIGNSVFAYASYTNDLELKSKVDFSRSELTQVRDSIALERCQMIYNKAAALIASLGDYGVKDVDLQELKTRIDRYADVLAAPRTSITERKSATLELSELIRNTNKILKEKLDKLMEKFRAGNTEFHTLYFNARKTVNIGIRHEDDGIDPPSSQKPAA